MQTPPLPVMPVPHDIESNVLDEFFHMVEARERRVELVAGFVGKARTIARDEAVSAPSPSAVDVDGVVEGCRTDLGKEAWLQSHRYEALTPFGDGCLLVRSEGLDPDPFAFRLRHQPGVSVPLKVA